MKPTEDRQEFYVEKALGWLDKNTFEPVTNFLKRECTDPKKIDDLQQQVEDAIKSLDGIDDHLVQGIRDRLDQINTHISYHKSHQELMVSQDPLNSLSCIVGDAAFYHRKLAELQSLRGLSVPSLMNKETALKYDLLQIPVGFLTMGYMGLFVAVGVPVLLVDCAVETCRSLSAYGKEKVSPTLDNAYSQLRNMRKSRLNVWPRENAIY